MGAYIFFKSELLNILMVHSNAASFTIFMYTIPPKKYYIYFTFEMPKNGPHGPTTSAVQTSNWFDVDPTIKRICDSTYLYKKFVFLKMLHNINLSSTRLLIRKKIELCKKNFEFDDLKSF